MKKSLIALSFLLIISSCEDESDDKTKSVNTDGSIEVKLSVNHLGNGKDLLITTYKVWNKKLAEKEIIRYDTLNSLGNYIDTTEDDDGNEKYVTMKKDYEFYITVK